MKNHTFRVLNNKKIGSDVVAVFKEVIVIVLNQNVIVSFIKNPDKNLCLYSEQNREKP